MDENSSLLSMRIFTADHYMGAPIRSLDSTYSEFRGEQIKQVFTITFNIVNYL